MKTTTDARNDGDDAHLTVEQIVARIRWLDEMLMMLQRELAATTNPDQRRSSAKSLIH